MSKPKGFRFRRALQMVEAGRVELPSGKLSARISTSVGNVLISSHARHIAETCFE